MLKEMLESQQLDRVASEVQHRGDEDLLGPRLQLREEPIGMVLVNISSLVQVVILSTN